MQREMLKSKIHSEIVRYACIESVKGCLNRLAEKGVIVECEGD